MTSETLTVLYIGGTGRSGSTLLQRLLEGTGACFSAGEMIYLWERGFLRNELCGCGKPFRECEFWSAVITEAFGGFEGVDAERMEAFRNQVYRSFPLPRIAFKAFQGRAFRASLREYQEAMGKVYRAMQKVSGSSILVDSSKSPRFAYLIRQTPGVDLRAVHLVRDSRGVAYSVQKKLLRPEVYWEKTYTRRTSPLVFALKWDLENGLFHLLEKSGVSSLRVHYEDLIAQPREWVERILEFAGAQGAVQRVFKSDTEVILGANHSLGGNPNRFKRGKVELRLDSEWKEKLPRSRIALVTALTFPLLVRYGYLSANGRGIQARLPGGGGGRRAD